MFLVEMRVRAVLRHEVIEFAKQVALPFAPFPWMVLHEADEAEDGAGLVVEEVSWLLTRGRFVVRALDDLDAAVTFADDADGLVRSYTARGWTVFRAGPLRVRSGERLAG